MLFAPAGDKVPPRSGVVNDDARPYVPAVGAVVGIVVVGPLGPPTIERGAAALAEELPLEEP